MSATSLSGPLSRTERLAASREGRPTRTMGSGHRTSVMETNVVGRIVLVTGGNKGLGFETARRLKALGYTVYTGVVPVVKRELRRSA